MKKRRKKSPRIPREIESNNWASCEDCGEEWEGISAHGVGYIHARTFGHTVNIRLDAFIVYNP